VDRVVDVRGDPHQRFYRVRWKGYEEKDDTWQNWRDLEEGGMDAIDAFWETQDVFKRDKPAWIHGEIRCKNCCKDRTVSGTFFKSEKSLKDHHKCKWKVASRAGTRAERLVISKRKKRAMEARGKVLMESEPLKHAFTFTYLGYDFRADGKAEHAIEERMRKAALRFSRMCHIWRSKELDTTLKLRLYAAAVASVLVYGCEAWPITEKVTKWVGAWNARRLSFITDREIRDEYLVPSFDIVARIRARRLTWAGHLLREKEKHLPRRVAVARLKSDLQEHRSLRSTNGLFQDAPAHSTYKELEDMAQNRRFWRSLVAAIEPEDTLELQKRKRARGKRSSGTTTLDLDASQWLKGVNKQGKFDGGLIAK
jgi:hypothetical protein